MHTVSAQNKRSIEQTYLSTADFAEKNNKRIHTTAKTTVAAQKDTAELPLEIWDHIFSFFTNKELLPNQQCSHQFQLLAKRVWAQRDPAKGQIRFSSLFKDGSEKENKCDDSTRDLFLYNSMKHNLLAISKHDPATAKDAMLYFLKSKHLPKLYEEQLQFGAGLLRFGRDLSNVSNDEFIETLSKNVKCHDTKKNVVFAGDYLFMAACMLQRPHLNFSSEDIDIIIAYLEAATYAGATLAATIAQHHPFLPLEERQNLALLALLQGDDAAVKAYARQNDIILDEAYEDLIDLAYGKEKKCGLGIAIEIASKALELNMDMDKTIFLRKRGQCYQEQEEYDKAIADYTEALKQADGKSKAFFLRAQCYHIQGNTKLAINDLKQISILEPKNEDIKSVIRELTR